jgi:DNA replication protein DnaC
MKRARFSVLSVFTKISEEKNILDRRKYMTNEATVEKMRKMKLKGMARAFENSMSGITPGNLTSDEMAAYLTDAEWDERYNRKLAALIKRGRFRYQAVLESLNFRPERNLDKNLILRLSNCDWIRKKENIIITGATGCGKSYIASALGNQACRMGYRTLYYNCMKLFTKLKFAKAEGSYVREMKLIQRQDLLILDDFGLEVLDGPSRLSLLEILEDRHGKNSTLITSQLPVKDWFDKIGDPTIADAICDRIIHSAIKIDLEGDSMRKIYANDSSWQRDRESDFEKSNIPPDNAVISCNSKTDPSMAGLPGNSVSYRSI